MSKYYPDISHHEKVTDWSKVVKACPFIITKATQGLTFVDPLLNTVIRECEKRKKPYWLYAYLNRGKELAQAKFLVETCRERVGKYFVGYILDVECKEGNNVTGVRDALKYISNLGYKSMIYTMYAQHTRYKSVIDARPKNCAWWEARYGKNNGTYSKKYPAHKGVDFHQFTENGSCPGMSGEIDLNRLTGTKTESWFTDPKISNEKTNYPGTFPALPPRGYYQQGDGYETLKDYPTQIRRVQELLNWVMDASIDEDGKYGADTVKLESELQEKYGLPVNGKFGDKSLAACKKVKK